MKVLILAVVLCLCCIGVSHAAINIETHAGAYYSFKDHALNHAETVDLFSYKDTVRLEAGYSGDGDESDHKGILALSLDIKQLKLGTYIKIPILDLLEFRPAVFVGLGSINSHDLGGSKFDYGIGASLISYKF